MNRTDADLDREDDLERALGTMFARRSLDITVPSSMPSLSASGAEGAVRAPRSRRRYAVLAAAACVLAVVAGVTVGARVRHDQRAPVGTSPVPSTSQTSRTSAAPGSVCRVGEPAVWSRAVAAAALRLDSPTTQPVAAAADALVASQFAGSGQTQELAVFDAAGRGTTIWRPTGRQGAVVARSGAVDDDWIVFSTIHGQTDTPVDVYAWDRSGSGRARAVRVLSDSELLQGNLVLTGAPVVSGDTVYWVQQVYRKDMQQTVYSLDLAASGARPRVVAAVADVTQLVVLADGSLGYVHGDGSLTGDRVPAAVTRASRGGLGHAVTAAGVQWLVPTGQPRGASVLHTWSGGSTLTSRTVPALGAEPVVAGPFVVPAYTDPGTAQAVFDTRSGALVTLAAGQSLTVASDRFAAVGVAGAQPSKFGSTRLSRPALSALPAPTC